MTTLPQPRRSVLHRMPRQHGVRGHAERAAAAEAGSMTPPASNADPVAAFNAPDSIVAGSAARFDAAASERCRRRRADLQLGVQRRQRRQARGGGKQIAQAFAIPGTYTVRLTVRGRSRRRGQRVAHTRCHPRSRIGRQRRHDDRRSRPLRQLALADVTVTNADNAVSVTTAADGRAALTAPRGVDSILRLSKAGYADQIKTLALPAGAESGYLEATMAPREPELTPADAAVGGTLTGKDGASVLSPQAPSSTRPVRR